MNEKDKNEWTKFRERGLLFITNQFLHIFGYALVYEFDENDTKCEHVIGVHPERVPFRGFSQKCTSDGYQKIDKYLEEYGHEIYEESTK